MKGHFPDHGIDWQDDVCAVSYMMKISNTAGEGYANNASYSLTAG